MDIHNFFISISLSAATAQVLHPDWANAESTFLHEFESFVFPAFNSADHLFDGTAEPSETKNGAIGAVAVRAIAIDDKERLDWESSQIAFVNLSVREIDREGQMSGLERLWISHVEQHESGSLVLHRLMHVPAIGFE